MMKQQVTVTETLPIHTLEGEAFGSATIHTTDADPPTILLVFDLGEVGKAAVRLVPSDAHALGVKLAQAGLDLLTEKAYP